MKSLNILQVVPYFYPAWAYGGPAKLVYDTSLQFAREGHRVTVYTSDAFDRNQRMPVDKRISGIKNLRVRYFRNVSNTLSYVHNMHIQFGLLFTSIFEVKKFDCIHLHDFYTFSNVWITWLARLYGIPYVLSVHGCLEEERVQQKSSIKKIFLFMFGNTMLRGAAKVIATSENEERAYKAFGLRKDKIVRLGHGVNRQEFATHITRNDARKKLKLAPSNILFTYIGRIHSIKGLDLLVQAFSALKMPQAKLLIAGSDDGYLPELKKLIQNFPRKSDIVLKSSCFGQEKAKVFRASDAFVYPSRSEGFSLGILEAASVGLPLILSEGCHFPQIERVKAGFVVETSVSGLKKGMEKFCAISVEKRKEMGKRAAQFIENDFSLTVICSKLIRMYSSLQS